MSDDMADNFLEHLEEQGCLKESFIIPKRKMDEGSPIKTTSATGDGDSEAKRRKISESQLTALSTAKEIHELLYNDQIPSDLVAQCTMKKCLICNLEFPSHISNVEIFNLVFPNLLIVFLSPVS